MSMASQNGNPSMISGALQTNMVTEFLPWGKTVIQQFNMTKKNPKQRTKDKPENNSKLFENK